MSETVVPVTASVTTDRDLLIELLKLRSTEAGALLTNVIRVTTVFLAITGAIFKFALDANATPALRIGLGYVGLGFTFVIWLACIFCELYRRSLYRSLVELHALLALSVAADQMFGVRYGACAVALGNVALLGGWFYLIRL